METILDILETTEARCGDRPAVYDGQTRLTYRELGAAARRIGASLCGSVRRGEPVAILAEKSCAVLACMYGVVYAGGFYVNINPEQPPERIRKILEVLQARCVLTDAERRPQLEAAGYRGRTYSVEELFAGDADGGAAGAGDIPAAAAGAGDAAGDMPAAEVSAQLRAVREQMRGTDPLYGVFTSGSTGTPKGIVVSHRAVIDFIGHFTEIFGITQEDVLGNQAPFDFDVSVKDLYSALFTGAEAVLIPRTYFSTPPRLLDYLCDSRVTVLVWAVSALCLVSGLKGLRYRVPEHVRLVMFSGEVMPVKHLTMWQDALPEAAFVNLYGPSEITCNCTYCRITRRFDKTEKIPIGTAFPGRTVFLADPEAQVPEDGAVFGPRLITQPGEAGELCVAGESLAEGYYRDPAQTARRFVRCRMADGEVRRVYRTGDLACYGEDGLLYFAGRSDFQIKHMGHRIELEEIETNFMALDGVERAVCLFDEDRNRLVCWYTGTPAPGEVRGCLKERVPAYMIPSKIFRTEEMPLNKNGKIDRAFFRAQLHK